MAISLSKGQKVDLTKGRENLKNLRIELGWDTNRYSGGNAFDLDASCFLISPSGLVRSDQDFIFYNNKLSDNGSVVYGGDNRTGDGAGVDEIITIELKNVPSNVSKIAFTVTIHDFDTRKQNFGMVENAFIKAVDNDTNEEILNYDLDEDFSIESAVVIAEIYRHDSEWRFNAIGSGFDGGLFALCKNFGVDVE